jgi:hypothetical protein
MSARDSFVLPRANHLVSHLSRDKVVEGTITEGTDNPPSVFIVIYSDERKINNIYKTISIL